MYCKILMWLGFAIIFNKVLWFKYNYVIGIWLRGNIFLIVGNVVIVRLLRF